MNNIYKKIKINIIVKLQALSLRSESKVQYYTRISTILYVIKYIARHSNE